MSGGGFYNELEYLVLALIGEGLGSGYAIRKAMNRMRGGRWSSESGSVYRVLRRLLKDDLVREVQRVGAKNRERFEYELTGQGQAVLSSWLILPPVAEEFAFLVDPIRTRSYFLDRMSPDERAKVVENWISLSRTFCSGLEKELEEVTFPSEVRRLAYKNLLCLGKARHEWLNEMLQVVLEENGKLGAKPKEPDAAMSTL